MEGEKKPPTTTRLALLLQNKDLLSMNVDYQSTREAFLEVSTQLDEIKRTVAIFEQAESKFAKITDTQIISQNIDKVSEQVDRNSEDFSTELRELRAYFSFQIKELNSKIDNNILNMINEISKPVSAPITPTLPGDIPIGGALVDPQLRADVDNLKERFESLLGALSQPETGKRLDGEEEEEEDKVGNGDEEEDSYNSSRNNQKLSSRSNKPNKINEKKDVPPPPSTPTRNGGDDSFADNPISSPDLIRLTDDNSGTVSSPSLVKTHISPIGKSTAYRKAIEVRLDDIKIQFDGINNQLKKYDEKVIPLIPVVQKSVADIDLLRPDLLKMKADVILLKGDMERVKDTQANSVVDFMKELNEKAAQAQTAQTPDIEKPLLAMRHQFMQQFAKMENAFNEQLRKLRAEIIGIKTITNEIKDLPPPTPPSEDEISIVSDFAREEPEEKVLLEQMQREAEEERIRKQEELARLAKEAEAAAAAAAARAKDEREKQVEIIKQREEERFALESARAVEAQTNVPEDEEVEEKTFAEIEIQTEFDESTLVRRDQYTEVTNLPNQMIVSVIVDSPPNKSGFLNTNENNNKNENENKNNDNRNKNENGKMNENTRSKSGDNEKLAVRATAAFEYAHLAAPTDEETLISVRKDIQRHQEVLERIVAQIADTRQPSIEVPSASSQQQQAKSSVGSALPAAAAGEFKALKETCSSHGRSIESLEQKIRDLQQMNGAYLKNQLNSSRVPSQEVSLAPKQIILSPVLFTPLYISSPNVYRARSNTTKPIPTTNIASKSHPKPTDKPPKPKTRNKKRGEDGANNNAAGGGNNGGNVNGAVGEAPAPAIKKHGDKNANTTQKSNVPKIPRKNSKQDIAGESEEEDRLDEKTGGNNATNSTDNKNRSPEDSKEDNHQNDNSKEQNNQTNNEKESDQKENQKSLDKNQQSDKRNLTKTNVTQIDIENNDVKDLTKNGENGGNDNKSARNNRSGHSSHRSSNSQKEQNEEDKSGIAHNSNQNSSRDSRDLKNRDKSEHHLGGENENPEHHSSGGWKDVNDGEEDNVENNSGRKKGEEEEEEEANSQIHSNRSEFFSPNDSSVGTGSYYPLKTSEEEEMEEMDPMIKDKFLVLDDTLTSHQDQIRNIREGLVELRTNIQIIKAERRDDISVIPQADFSSERQASSADFTRPIADDNAIRALRRRFDAQTREFEDELYKIRKEILEIRHEQSKAPQTIERIIQVPVQISPQKPAQPIPVSSIDTDPSKNDANKPKSSIFDEENRILNIKPIQIPNLFDDNNKVPKIPIVDGPLTPPESHSVPRAGESKISAKSTTNSRTQPSTPKAQKPLLPLLPPTTPTEAQTPNASPKDEYRPFFHNVVQQTINELSVLNATDGIDEHILLLISEVRARLMIMIDKNTKRLTDIEAKIDTFVDKEYVAKFFQKMRARFNEVNETVNTMKNTMPERVTKEELQTVTEELYHTLTQDQETSGGTTSYRCLLCGRPKTSITGMIKDFKVAETLGQPTQTTVAQSPQSGTRGTLIYGPDKQLYRGKGNFGRPTIALVDSKKTLPKMK